MLKKKKNGAIIYREIEFLLQIRGNQATKNMLNNWRAPYVGTEVSDIKGVYFEYI